ncbi:MAG: hypothetical protein IPI67_41215 [Myxococcales bacterium]|nr:hypothetical protein [Myxococcales bacterium]
MRPADPRPTSWEKLGVAALLLVFCIAPTPGDIGGCGQSPELLSPTTFFGNKKLIDCSRCDECGFATDSCTNACDDEFPVATAFPKDCFPLVHDGEVCLRALRYAACGDYETYVDDVAPSAPSECNFCPPDKGP